MNDRLQVLHEKMEANGYVWNTDPLTPSQTKMVRRFDRRLNRPDGNRLRLAMGMAQQYKYIMEIL